jgi:hypothetical protein
MKSAALAALLILPGVSAAQSLRLQDTTTAEYQGDNGNTLKNDDNYGLGRNRLYVNGLTETTSASAQVDGVAFTRYPDVAKTTPAAPSAYRSEARLERLLLTYNKDALTLTLGDHPRQLGRGIALSLRKIDELGTDHALRGGAARVEGDTFTGEAFAGTTNVENLDPVTLKFRDDPGDTLAGASTTLHVSRADISLHGLYVEPAKPLLPAVAYDHTALGGGFVEFPASSWLSLYAEGAFERYAVGGREHPGTAAYLAADVDMGVVSLLVEGERLDGFEVQGSRDPVTGQRFTYNQPPTLERLDQEVFDNRDVLGGRARLSRSFYEGGLVTYVNGMVRQSGPDSSHVMALHGYGGFEMTYGAGRSRWNLSGGYRRETRQADANPFKTMVHGETQWVQSLSEALALHIDVLHESRRLEQRDYFRGSTLLGVERPRLGTLTTEIGYDTQNPQQRNVFLAGILTWKATDAVFVRAIVGTQRGGIKCIGGVCRDFPPFSGARLEAAVTYDAL